MSATTEALRRAIERDGRSVDIAPAGSRDTWHGSSPGSSSSHKALIQNVEVEEMTEAGEVVTHDGTAVIMSGDVTVGMQDELTLPDGETPRLVSITKQRDHRSNVALTVLEAV